MTNEELIAQAREWLTEEAKRLQELVDTLEQLVPLSPSPNGIRAQQLLNAKRRLNLVTTNLAEIDEHKGRDPFECGDSICPACTTLAPTTERAPCDFLITKSKRLLGG
jgi:hypothetical protein